MEDAWRHNVTVASDHPKYHEFGLDVCFFHIYINQFSDLHPNTLKSSYGIFRCEFHAVEHAVSKFLEE